MIHLPCRQDVVLRGGVNMAPPPFCWKTLNWTRPLHHSPRISPGQIWRKFTNRKSLTWQEGRPDGNNRWRLCSFCFMHHVMSFHRFHRATTEAHVNNSTLHPYFLAQHLESYLILHSLRKNPEPTDPTFSQQVFSTSDSTSSLKELWFAACAPRTGLSSGRMPKQKRIRQGQRGCRH